MITRLEEVFIILLQKLRIFDFSLIFTRLFDWDLFSLTLIMLTYIEFLSTSDLYLVLLGIILVTILKIQVKRIRPYVNNKEIERYNNGHIDKNSYPSGHSFISELLILIIKTKLNLVYGSSQYILASIIPYCVAFSRVYSGDHYFTDVISGIIFARSYYYLYNNSSTIFYL